MGGWGRIICLGLDGWADGWWGGGAHVCGSVCGGGLVGVVWGGGG